MDFKSMLASLWVPFFVLLAFIPGSALNTIERQNTTKATVLPSTVLRTTITDIKRRTPSLLNETINDKTIQRGLPTAVSTQGIGGHALRRKERNEQKAIKMDPTFDSSREIQPSTISLTTLFTSIGTEAETTTPTDAKTTGKPAMNTTKNKTKNGMLAEMNVSFSLQRKDLLNPPTKEPDLASTITPTLLSLRKATASKTTMTETTKAARVTTTILKTTELPLRSPWEQVTKALEISVHPVTQVAPVVVVEKRTLNHKNNNNTEGNFNNFDYNNRANESKSEEKFNSDISWKSEAKEFNIDGIPPQPLPSPKYYHGIQIQKMQQEMDSIKRFSPHFFKNPEQVTSAKDPLSDCESLDCIKADNNSQLLSQTSTTVNESHIRNPTSSPFIEQPSSMKVNTTPTSEIPPLTTTTKTTIKSTTKPRRVVATTTLKPPPTIDDFRTIISQAGTHAYLPCNVKQLVKKPISWLRVRDGHILTVDQTTFIADQRFQSIFSSSPERWSLQIKYVQPKDAGTYECQVSTEPKASAIVNLHIIEPKTELIGEPTRHVKAGSQVKLRCIISQALEPPLFINWFYNQKQIYLHNRKGWRTEIERIDLPPETTTTTEATTTTTTIKTTTTTMKMTETTTIQMRTLPSLTTPTTVVAGVGDIAIEAGIGISEVPPVSESTIALGAVATHFSSSVTYDGNTGTVSSTVSTISPTPTGELRETSMPTMAMTTMAALAMADVKQITAASLIITSVGKQDSGNYTCSPSNSAPRTVVLHVLNGEYSASAITSGCGRNILIAYNAILEWPHRTTAILILLWLIKIFVAMEFQWICSQVKNNTRHDRHAYKELATDTGYSCGALSNNKSCSNGVVGT